MFEFQIAYTMDDFDTYILTPLTEVEDAETETAEMPEEDDTAMAAEDYVQSLVTIESNWANGKVFYI